MAETHSFDIVCKVEMHEIKNAIDQAQKQIAVRYDFKGSKSSITLNKDDTIILFAEDDYKLSALTEILKEKMAKRNIPLKAFTFGKTEDAVGGTKRQTITLQTGIPTDNAKEIVKVIKNLKLKVQAKIQEDQVRVSGQKIDDLQMVMKELKDLDNDFAMQFINYK